MDSPEPFDLSLFLAEATLVGMEEAGRRAYLALRELERQSGPGAADPRIVFHHGALSGESLWTLHGLFCLDFSCSWRWAGQPLVVEELCRRWPRYGDYVLDRMRRQLAYEEREAADASGRDSDRDFHRENIARLEAQLAAAESVLGDKGLPPAEG